MNDLTIIERIEGNARFRILREFVTNAALFPLFDALRSITADGLVSYVSDPAHYLIFISAAVQAWYLGRMRAIRWWQRAVGNVIGVTIYTVLDMIMEGPKEFLTTPYHWIYWIFSIGLAILYALTELVPRMSALCIVILAWWRVLLFPALYTLSELSVELPTLSGEAFRAYWASSSGHTFILLASLLFGVLLGLGDAQIYRYTDLLRNVSRHLKQFSEWSLDPQLIARSLDDRSVLGQRRVQRAVLFMDIRGFTSWSEHKDPEAVIQMLNQFYDQAEQIILSGGGRKPHFIGDEVMTWFVSPQQALEAANKLKQQMNVCLAKHGLAVGIGLHLGEVVEGIMGSSQTRNYNIIGDTVNTASRLVSAAEPGELLVSDTLKEYFPATVLASEPKTIQAKGKSVLIEVYRYET